MIDRWYEDDGVSGYKFDRPGFNQLMEDLDKDIDRVFVKDFSRLGRHNAKVLLLLDDFKERGKQLLVIDDNYDSMHADDDTIGIKTWYNERYVKDTSQKIKRALTARQKEGTLITQPPFGYKRNEKDKFKVEIVSKEAAYIKRIYDLYLQGFGYRMIANYLTENKIPTPSMLRHERELEKGRITKPQIATKWSDSMVKDILGNDFYIGTLRLRKRARTTVHGKDKRIPKDEQYVFENNHPAIIDKASFALIQDIKEKRIKSNYRGSRGRWRPSELPNPFGSCLFCKDCGRRLTPIRRNASGRERKYYICTTYNTKGKRYCARAHLIEEEDLMEDVVTYLKLCRNSFCEIISAYDKKDFAGDIITVEKKCFEIQIRMDECKKQLNLLLAQKIKDLTKAHGNEDILKESYDALQQDILAQIQELETQLKNRSDTCPKTEDMKKEPQNPLQALSQILEKKVLDRRDIEILIERIEVDEDGFPEIKLKYGLSALIQHSPAQEMNRRENEIIYQTMKLILEDGRGYTSANYLSKALTEIGYPKSVKNVLPYIGLMIDLGIVEPSTNSLKPYTIIKTRVEIQEMMANFRLTMLPKPNDNNHSATGFV